jgi:superfamily I DNA and/or RNA helicase
VVHDVSPFRGDVLPPGSIEFDVLVIDEASQMRPEDALGVLRAKHIVVVVDQRQLSPT